VALATYGAAMAAEGALRRAWLRRWASLSVVVALLFATSAVAAAVEVGAAVGPGNVPIAVQVVGAAQQASGQRPDVRVDARGGPGTVAPELAALAWLAARAGTSTVWWHRPRDGQGRRAQAQRETYQGRGPPGQRAVDALS
jgi:hypothetical protein